MEMTESTDNITAPIDNQKWGQAAMNPRNMAATGTHKHNVENDTASQQGQIMDSVNNVSGVATVVVTEGEATKVDLN